MVAEASGTECAGAGRQGLSGLVGPVSPGLPGADLAAQRGRAVSCRDRDHPRRAGAGGDRGARTRRSHHRYRLHRKLRSHQAGRLKVLKGISADTAKLGGGTGKGLLIVDDLVDTGKTGRLVREMMPDAHFATVYAKPIGTAAGRYLHHRSVAGHLDFLSLGYRAVVPAADPRRRGVTFRHSGALRSDEPESMLDRWLWIPGCADATRE